MKLSQLSLADYNQLDSIPVINQDLSAADFTPTANTYYRHTGTTDTYTQGIIYCYDGTEYKALDGSGGGGISDVKVNGTSVVTDGVTNIPPASESISGVVTNNTQTFSGLKRFNDNIQMTGSYIAFRSRNVVNPIYIGRYSDTSGVAGISTAASNTNTVMEYLLYGHGKALGSSSSDCSYIQISPKSRDAIIRYHKTYGISYAMFAPDSWSSGTSGSVTLTESGTYQIYMNDGKNNINFGLVYFDASTDTYAQTPMINHTEGFMLSIEGSAGDNPKTLHIYQIDNVGHTQTEVNYTVYYRRVGI